MSDRPPGPDRLPDGLEHVRTTDVFANDTVPAGLLRAHRVADGVWARLLVHTGTVGFVFEDDADRPLSVTAGESLVIPPGRLHHVELEGPATFALEFHREPRPEPVRLGRESTGLDDPDDAGGPGYTGSTNPE